MLLNTAHYDPDGNDRKFAENELSVEILDDALSCSAQEREIKLYGTHFKAWCQAFGEHENILVDDSVSCWLLGGNQVGLVLSKPQIRQLNQEVLFHEKVPTLIFDEQGVHIGVFFFSFENKHERQVLRIIERLFDTGAALHLFVTSHFLYGNRKKLLLSQAKDQHPLFTEKLKP